MSKAIITVVGKDTVGIIAKVCTYLADNQVNILDITQTILDGYFNMMMIADTAKCEKDGGELAKELDMPVIIHDRDAHRDCLEILRKYKPQGILHRFGGPVEMLKEAMDWGMYVSFNNDLTYPAWNKPHIDCLMATPWDKLLIETDCPYAPPFERKDDRCESYDVANVVKEIAKLRNVSEEFVAKTSLENAKKIYKIDR